MKLRTNYVSNSSSSSFIVNCDLTDKGIYCYALRPNQLASISETINGVQLDADRTWYLTESVTDCNYGTWIDAREGTDYYEYVDLALGGEPYDEEHFIEVADRVWLLRKDVPELSVAVDELSRPLSKWFAADTKFIPVLVDGGVMLYTDAEPQESDDE
jgi:hypothetical protein